VGGVTLLQVSQKLIRLLKKCAVKIFLVLFGICSVENKNIGAGQNNVLAPTFYWVDCPGCPGWIDTYVYVLPNI